MTRFSGSVPRAAAVPFVVRRGAPVQLAAQRAASLLRGGVPAARVWTALAGSGADFDPDAGLAGAARIVERGVIDGRTCGEALAAVDGPGWRVLAAVWMLAEESGAPFAAVLDRFAQAMRELHRISERRSVLLAGPRATIRLVIGLPLLAMLLGALLGFDPLLAMASPIGLTAAASGALLLVLGARWAAGLARRLERVDWVAGWEFELAAIALSGGAPPAQALRRAVDATDRARAGWVRLEAFGADGSVVRAIESVDGLGVPVGPVLRAEAEHARAAAQAELEQAAERLGVRVLLPLGVCVLPAFVLLGVVPVLLAVLGGAGL